MVRAFAAVTWPPHEHVVGIQCFLCCGAREGQTARDGVRRRPTPLNTHRRWRSWSKEDLGGNGGALPLADPSLSRGCTKPSGDGTLGSEVSADLPHGWGPSLLGTAYLLLQKSREEAINGANSFLGLGSRGPCLGSGDLGPAGGSGLCTMMGQTVVLSPPHPLPVTCSVSGDTRQSAWTRMAGGRSAGWCDQ